MLKDHEYTSHTSIPVQFSQESRSWDDPGVAEQTMRILSGNDLMGVEFIIFSGQARVVVDQRNVNHLSDRITPHIRIICKQDDISSCIFNLQIFTRGTVWIVPTKIHSVKDAFTHLFVNVRFFLYTK
jgi:hypothetical protein